MRVSGMIRIRFKGSRRKLLKAISGISISVNRRAIIRFRDMVRVGVRVRFKIIIRVKIRVR